MNTKVGLLLLVTATLIINGCNPNARKRNNPTPAEYDLNYPEVLKLSDRLNETSGLAYYSKDSSIFTIVDEVGVLYKLSRQGEKLGLEHWRFSKTGDYEDIVLKDSIFYIIKSKGHIIAVSFQNPDSIRSQQYKISLSGKNEFESLYYDDSIGKMVLLCKDCEEDDKTKVSTYAFDPATGEYSEGPFVIDPSQILATQKVEEKKFKPSAATIHPLTGELYIVSSINKVLVIADRKGKIKKVYPLDPELYKQPEGITFAPSGDMFISNEAAGEGLATLLYYKYKNAGHEK